MHQNILYNYRYVHIMKLNGGNVSMYRVHHEPESILTPFIFMPGTKYSTSERKHGRRATRVLVRSKMEREQK